jgi:PAS domain S-box-containing protein
MSDLDDTGQHSHDSDAWREADDKAIALARLAAIVESCEDAIVGKTLEGIVTSWNRGAERLFGYAAAEAIGRSILLIVPPERRGEEATILARLQRGERIEHFETERLTKQGERIEVSLTVSPIRDGTGKIVGASKVARDIRERRRIQESQERLMEAERYAREQAQRAGLLKDEFFSILSHELRTPLSAMQAWGHLLATGRARTEEIPNAGEVILRNAALQKRVIDDLLDINRVVSGRLRLDKELLDPIQSLQAALEKIAPAAAVKGIRIVSQLERLPVLLRGDPLRLQQVAENLLSNAIKFTPKGGEVSVVATRAGRQLEISFADNGAGIRAEFLPHVFERFSQADPSPSRRYGGLGLGLPIAKHVIELHGGSLSARSPGQDQGATFTIVLPLENDPGLAIEPRSPAFGALRATSGDKVDLSGLDVLVVDDESDARQFVSRILNDSGATVYAADSAASAISMIRQHMPHVLVSDIGMPGIDGYEMIRRIRRLEGAAARIPAIALTAFSRPTDQLTALHAGYVVHLVKPADPNQLVETVAAAGGRSST